MSSKKIVFLDKGTLDKVDLVFDFPFEMTNVENCAKDEDSVSKAIQGHEIAISNKVPISRKAMEENPQLKLIAVSATGFNIIDIEAARELGITVCNVANYSGTAVAEHAFMMMISLMHRLPVYEKEVRADGWQKSEFFTIFAAPIFELKGKTLGIFGKGDIGKKFAEYATAFGMNVLFSDRKNAKEVREGYVAFEDVLKQADVFSIHAPLTIDTKNLIDEKELAIMKDDVIIINVSRGGLVNELAMANALRNRTVGGAGFDVLTTEPPKPDNPLLASDLGNFILTPHTAWMSEEALENLVGILQNNINQFVKGTPVNVVS